MTRGAAGAPADRTRTGESSRTGFRWALVALTLAALALYLFRIDAKSIWWDESLSLYRARLPLRDILSNRITYGGVTTVDLHPPLYFALLGGLTRILGESDAALRLLSACAGALLVPLLYAMGSRLRGRMAGLLAAVYGAASPLVLWYSQEARMYTLVTVLCLLAFYSLWMLVAEGRGAWALGLALSAAAALATQYLSSLVLAALLVLAVVVARARREPAASGRRTGLGTAALTVAGAILLGAGAWYGRTALGLLRQPAAGREYIPLGEMFRDALNSFSLGATVDPQTALPLDLLFLAVFAAGVVALWRRPPTALGRPGAVSLTARLAGPVALVGIVLVPIVGMWLYSLVVGPIYMGSRYVIMSLPAFALGLGIGLDAIGQWKAPVGAVLALALVAGIGVSDVRYFTHPDYRAKEDHRATAELVMALEAPGDAILLTAPENITAFEHYYRGRLPIYPVPTVALSGPQSPERIDADLRAVVDRGYRRLWLVHCRTQHSDPEDGVLAWLEANALFLERTVYPSAGSTATVSAWLPGPPVGNAAPSAGPIGVFGERLALEALSVESESAPATAVAPEPVPVEAGRSLVVSATWRPLAALDRYKVSLRLLDGAGLVWAQEDRLPYMYLPTDEWPTGSAVRHDARLRVPAGTPPGTYRLQYVLYYEASGQALTFRAGGSAEDTTALDVGEITVTRSTAAASQGEVLAPGIEAAMIAARFGADLSLWAWQTAPESLQPGERLTLNLFWKALRSPEEEYVLVVSLRDEGGRVWDTSEHALTGVNLPTTSWQTGELLRGIVAVDLPADAPRGRHTVHLLVYAPGSGRFEWVGRGPLPWTGRQLSVGVFTVR